MAILGVFLIVVFVITSLLLILLVLLQDEQGEGLGGIFGGGGASQVFGVQSDNILSKGTKILGVIFFLCVIGIAWVYRTPEAESVLTTARQEKMEQGVRWWEEELPAGEEATVPAEQEMESGTGASSSE
ncbi:preprotein translocase, SecG subunit [Spirochaeta thermophila DSM 6578]|uniref:Protein-export membrane protein SecG n=1 Tax=Winmispira thermophila (strain ATCC 700085 / DSM 6578 / Z-1203) TaxID=869211 RepID=G0GCY7_WINT7|nr:preprotein translocase subunit SecG [Spirochaeta thermophila]AEJ61279.1 preprotein translocase, SecG subunit [Spirochaeta thermophila DSM 6578]